MALQRDKIVGNAEKLVAKGKIEPAIREYERLLGESPNDVNTLNRIGDLWVRIDRNDEAVKVFRKIADHYARDGFFLKAIAIFKKINKLDPSKLDIYAKLAELYAKQGLAMEAKSQYMVLADYYVKHEDVESATGIYLKIAELDPHSVNVRIKLADLYTMNGQTPQALQEYDRVGRMLLKRGMSSEAVQVFRKALKIDSGNIDLVESVVSSLLEEKEYSSSIEIAQSALESNKENARLIILLSNVHLAKDDGTAAREVLDQGLSANPNEFGIREGLAELHLREGDPDKAVELIGPVLSTGGDKSEETRALMLLERVAAAHPDHTGALEKLAAVYRRIDDDSHAIDAMTRLANAHVDRKEFTQAETIFRDLARRDPDNSGHRDRLAELAQETGSAVSELDLEEAVDDDSDSLLDFSESTPEQFPEPEPDTASPAAVEQTSTIEAAEQDELEEETIDLDFPDDIEASPEPEVTVPDVLTSESDHQAASELLEFITEHLTEADVFAKYGLYDKAIEHLRTIIGKAPRHRAAYEKLLNVYMNEGLSEPIRETANRYIALLRIEGDMDEAEAVEQRIWNRGYSTGQVPEHEQAAPSVDQAVPELLPEELAPMESAGAANDDPVVLVEEVPELQPEFEDLPDLPSGELPVVESSESPLAEETLVADAIAEEPQLATGNVYEFSSDADLASDSAVQPDEISFEEEAPVDEEAQATAPDELETPDEEPILFIEPVAEVSASPAPELDPFDDPGIGSSFQDGASSPSMEDLGELDFYIEQDLLEEAGNKLETLSAQFPMHAEILQRQEALHAARSRIAGTLKAYESMGQERVPAHPPALTHDDIESELTSAIHDEPEDAEAVSEPLMALPELSDDQELFAAEDDFFDLAAELGEDLDESDLSDMGDDEQSLEQIFREFKKGVEQQLDSEDYDTHYNLGIAYKEMGLIDEAIGEFQLASKDPHRAIDGCSMLGLCFLEKGMPQLAIKWYNKGLEMAEISEEEHMGLLYDLGAAYLEVGDIDAAHKAFIEVYGINSKYRDIAGRIKQLDDVRRAT